MDKQEKSSSNSRVMPLKSVSTGIVKVCMCTPILYLCICIVCFTDAIMFGNQLVGMINMAIFIMWDRNLMLLFNIIIFCGVVISFT